MNLAHLLFLFSFESARRPKAVQGGQRHPTGTQDAQKDRKGRPMGAQRRLKGSQRHPSRSQGVQQVSRDGQVEPKGTPKGAKGNPKSAQGSPKATEGGQRTSRREGVRADGGREGGREREGGGREGGRRKGRREGEREGHYINKLPINRKAAITRLYSGVSLTGN